MSGHGRSTPLCARPIGPTSAAVGESDSPTCAGSGSVAGARTVAVSRTRAGARSSSISGRAYVVPATSATVTSAPRSAASSAGCPASRWNRRPSRTMAPAAATVPSSPSHRGCAGESVAACATAMRSSAEICARGPRTSRTDAAVADTTAATASLSATTRTWGCESANNAAALQTSACPASRAMTTSASFRRATSAAASSAAEAERSFAATRQTNTSDRCRPPGVGALVGAVDQRAASHAASIASRQDAELRALPAPRSSPSERRADRQACPSGPPGAPSEAASAAAYATESHATLVRIARASFTRYAYSAGTRPASESCPETSSSMNSGLRAWPRRKPPRTYDRTAWRMPVA